MYLYQDLSFQILQPLLSIVISDPMELDGTISTSHDKWRYEVVLHDSVRSWSQMPMVSLHGQPMHQVQLQRVLLVEQVDISQSSELDEMVSIVHNSSKLEHVSESEQQLHDTHSMWMEPEISHDSVSQLDHPMDISSPLMPQVMHDGQAMLLLLPVCTQLELLQCLLVVDTSPSSLPMVPV